MKLKRLKTGIDVDDVLFACNEYAIQLANQDYQFDPPLDVSELTSWGDQGDARTNVIFDYYKKASFFKTQPILPGAKEFIRELSKMTEVFFVSAVYPEFMTIRALRLQEEFPEIPMENILLGTRKDLIHLDVVLDDGGHNIINSNAKFPVLLRKPWNQHLTGLLSVNTYDDFLEFINQIVYTRPPVTSPTSESKIICLIGPSGAGKNEIAQKLVKTRNFKKPKSYTTQPCNKQGYEQARYHHVSDKIFQDMKKNHEFLETTVYGGNSYGTTNQAFEDILTDGHHVVTVVDICGAMTLKKKYQDRCHTVFIHKDKPDIIRNILERDISNEEKLNCIISLNDEYKNQEICDEIVYNHGSIKECVDEIVKITKEK